MKPAIDPGKFATPNIFGNAKRCYPYIQKFYEISEKDPKNQHLKRYTQLFLLTMEARPGTPVLFDYSPEKSLNASVCAGLSADDCVIVGRGINEILDILIKESKATMNQFEKRVFDTLKELSVLFLETLSDNPEDFHLKSVILCKEFNAISMKGAPKSEEVSSFVEA